VAILVVLMPAPTAEPANRLRNSLLAGLPLQGWAFDQPALPSTPTMREHAREGEGVHR
jgi:hypothetical protein